MGMEEDPKLKKLISVPNLTVEEKNKWENMVASLVESFSITRAPELLLAQRMVSTWQKMQQVEVMLAHHPLVYEKKNLKGEAVAMKVNELAHYLKGLEADFRNYYKVLSGGKEIDEENFDFKDMVDQAKKVKGKK